VGGRPLPPAPSLARLSLPYRLPPRRLWARSRHNRAFLASKSAPLQPARKPFPPPPGVSLRPACSPKWLPSTRRCPPARSVLRRSRQPLKRRPQRPLPGFPSSRRCSSVPRLHHAGRMVAPCVVHRRLRSSPLPGGRLTAVCLPWLSPSLRLRRSLSVLCQPRPSSPDSPPSRAHPWIPSACRRSGLHRTRLGGLPPQASRHPRRA